MWHMGAFKCSTNRKQRGSFLHVGRAHEQSTVTNPSRKWRTHHSAPWVPARANSKIADNFLPAIRMRWPRAHSAFRAPVRQIRMDNTYSAVTNKAGFKRKLIGNQAAIYPSKNRQYNTIILNCEYYSHGKFVDKAPGWCNEQLRVL